MAQEAKIILTAQDNTSQAINAVQNKLKLVKNESVGASQGINKLENAFENLATDALGLNGGLGMAAESLMAFAGGGLLVGAVAVGIGLLVKYFIDLKNAQKDAKVASEDLRIALVGVTKGREAELLERTKVANQALAKAEQDLAKLQNQPLTIDAKTGLAKQTLVDPKQLAELQAARDKAQLAALQAGQAYSQEVNGRLERDVQAEQRRTQEAERNEKARAQAAKQAAADIKRSKDEERKAIEDAAKASASSISQQLAAYNDQLDALTKLVDIGVRGPDLSQALTDAIQRQSLVLANTTPLTKEYADELERLNKLKAAQLELDKSSAGTLAGLGPAGMAFEAVGLLKTQAAEMQAKWAEDTKNDVIQQALDSYASKAQIAADSFSLLFETMGQGGNYAQNLLRGFARMFAGIAKQKVGMNIAEGVENLAKAFAAMSNPFTAPFAAGYKTAAATNFKAAALWGAIAGAAGAAGGGGSGGGGGAAGGSGRTQSDNTDMARGNVTVIFPEGLVDLSNPSTQRQFTKLINEVAGNRSIDLVGA